MLDIERPTVDGIRVGYIWPAGEPGHFNIILVVGFWPEGLRPPGGVHATPTTWEWVQRWLWTIAEFRRRSQLTSEHIPLDTFGGDLDEWLRRSRCG